MDKPTVGHQYRVWFTNPIPPKEVTVLSVWTGAEAMAGRGELSHELATAVFFTGEEGKLYEQHRKGGRPRPRPGLQQCGDRGQG